MTRSLIEKLQIPKEAKFVFAVGAGGKTSLLHRLAKEYRDFGKKVILTTTTKMYLPEHGQLLDEDLQAIAAQLDVCRFAVVGRKISNEKMGQSQALSMQQLGKIADVVLVEADGSKRRPIKMPNDTEPVVTQECDYLITVVGLSCLGRPLQDVCHRFELTQLPPQEPIQEETLAEILQKGYGAYWKKWRGCVYLNQSDCVSRQTIDAIEARLSVPCAAGSLRNGDEKMNVYQALREYLKKDGMVCSALVIEGEQLGLQFLWNQHGVLCAPPEQQTDCAHLWEKVRDEKHANICDVDGQKIFVERFAGRPQLILLGGGHISLSLANLGKMLGFAVTVVDDRSEFANTTRFSMADTVICSDFSKAFEQIEDLYSNYYVVVTRGHQADETCVKEILKRKYSYLGMIGSKTKVAKTKENLLMSGFSSEKLDTIFAPIGLKIGAVTPEEIAVSIMAEIIQEKHKNSTGYIPQDVLECLSNGNWGELALIVKKHGSSPQVSGARMVVKDGKIVAGTIGGGAVENACVEHCKELSALKQPYDLKTFHLNPKDGADLGMICGGVNTIFFQQNMT